MSDHLQRLDTIAGEIRELRALAEATGNAPAAAELTRLMAKVDQVRAQVRATQQR